MILFEILRLDEYQCAKQQTIDLLSTSTNHITDPDFFEYETHIMFDDAMEWSENGDRTVNKFVTEFLETLDKTTAFLYSRCDICGKAECVYSARLHSHDSTGELNYSCIKGKY
ncbi:hypothetical protein EB796_003300 [Bugula neritina]|uniref:Uncharacterized protein n=1 Tax=Bugula neritina TaxID=10212 RepID=A0A7J7KJJ2_BUGNE|nr:hypothetical protein EB796_003300 [Bugula neritina]